MPSKKTKKNRTILSDEFYSDLKMQDMLYAILIRSPKKAGLIADIELPENFPEGYSLFTADDIPGNKTVKIHDIEVPVLCDKRVQYEGEPVAILTGPDENLLKKLKNKIRVVLHDVHEEEEPKEKSKSKEIKTGLAAKDEKLFSDFFEKTESTEQNQKKNTAKPYNVVKGRWLSRLDIPSYTETEGALCQVKNGNVKIFTPTRWISNLKKVVSEVLNIESENITITKTSCQPYTRNGGWKNSIICAQTALASLKSGKPVKLCFSEEEQKKFITCPMPLEIFYKTAIDKDGKITAMDINIDANIGAAEPFADKILERLMLSSCGIYNFPNLRIKATARTSRIPPTNQNMDFIITQACFSIESQMNKISEITDFPPYELRIKNIRTSSKDNFMPFTIPVENSTATIEALTRLCDFKRKFTTYRLDYLERQKNPDKFEIFPMRGIGFACSPIASDYFGSDIDFEPPKLEVELEESGSFTVKFLQPSPSILSIWKEMASSILGIRPSDIKINSNFDDIEAPPLPEDFYSNISVMTGLLKKCCLAILAKKGKTKFPLSIKKALPKSLKEIWNAETFSGKPYAQASFASAAVELEIEPCTFKCRLRGIWIVIDAGKLLLENEAQNRVYFEINRALGSFFEKDEIDCAKISVNFINSQSEPKPIQGLVLSTLPAAFLSALSQAISESLSEIPVNSEILFKEGTIKPIEFLDMEETAE